MSDQNITDWRKVGELLRPRKSPLSLQSNNIKSKVYWMLKVYKIVYTKHCVKCHRGQKQPFLLV